MTLPRRVRLRRDVAGGWVLRVTDGSHESNEQIPPSDGDRLLHDRLRVEDLYYSPFLSGP